LGTYQTLTESIVRRPGAAAMSEPMAHGMLVVTVEGEVGVGP
jgi:hypothetical protein